MKAVMISIQPKWCELIASGKKTVEVRKTRPKLETPFKVYIYCTNTKPYLVWGDVFGGNWETEFTHLSGYNRKDAEKIWDVFNGKVIGEFVCDKIYDITPHFDTPTFPNQYICGWEYGKEVDCLSFEELTSYLNGKQGFGWHISDLVIYDEPRGLGEFKAFCKSYYDGDKCDDCKYFIDDRGYEFDESDCGCNGAKPIERPPQSWCYVERSE